MALRCFIAQPHWGWFRSAALPSMSNGPGDLVGIEPPDHGAPVLVETKLAVKAVRQEGSASERVGSFRGWAGQNLLEPFRSPEDAADFRFALIPVEIEAMPPPLSYSV